MSINPEVIRERYAALSDDELVLIERAELTETARAFFDSELKRRNLAVDMENDPDNSDEGDGWFAEREDVEVEPDWMETAFPASVFSAMASGATSAAEARDALEAAGIPCKITEHFVEPEPRQEAPYREYRLMVPAGLSLQATSALDKAIYNAILADEWKNQLESLSDVELRMLDPETMCDGLLDRVNRLRRVYRDEVARRSNALR